MFTELKNKEINNLIIDLRGNGGGNSGLGDELFQYISPVPFRQFGKTIIRYSEPLRRKFPSWDLPPRDTIQIYSGTDTIALRDNPLRFAGEGKKVYVLTSPITFSSATDFTWAFQYFDMGTILGEETGGYIVCFGDVASFQLPHSRMNLGVSWKEFYGYGATEADRRPVQPDIAVPAEEALDYVLENLIE
jgi:C-terminal processing protease CtpA/Prc